MLNQMHSRIGKQILTLFLTLFIHISPLLWRGAGGEVQAQTYQWAHGFGGPNSDSNGNSIATDAQGNVYVTGTFADSIDFDPSTSGTAYLYTYVNNLTSFITKYDSSGNYIWAKSLDTPLGYCWTEKIVVNATGIYLTGHFALWIDFDPGPGNAILSSIGGWNGDEDIFIAHYDLNGNYLWAKSMGGLNEDKALDMAVDNVGNSYITGYFRDTVDLDPDSGVATFISEPIQDRFLAKYDANGNYVWAKDFCDDGSSLVIINKIAIDSISNYIYIVGFFRNTIDFDRGTGTFLLSSSGAQDNDGFVCKYDTAGSFIWGGSISGNWYQSITAIEVDKTGNGDITVAGGFAGLTDFDLGPGVLSVTASGSIFNGELFFAKYDGLGNNLWIKNIGNGSSIENVISIQTDSYGNYLIGGSFNDVLDFEPSIAVFSLSNTGSGSLPDIYFAKYDNNFNFLWARNIGGPYGDVPYDLNIDYQNNILLTGYFQSSSPVDFDPGSGTAFLNTNTTNNSIFIAKYQNIITGLFNQFENNTSALIVYPNPAKDKIIIGNLPAHVEELTITNSMRATVWHQQLANQTEVQLATVNLAPGLYAVSVKTKKEVLVIKFVKVE